MPEDSALNQPNMSSAHMNKTKTGARCHAKRVWTFAGLTEIIDTTKAELFPASRTPLSYPIYGKSVTGMFGGRQSRTSPRAGSSSASLNTASSRPATESRSSCSSHRVCSLAHIGVIPTAAPGSRFPRRSLLPPRATCTRTDRRRTARGPRPCQSRSIPPACRFRESARRRS